MKHQISGIKLVLLDIEGTICSISFVKEILFPYALKALPQVLADKWDDDKFAPYRDAFPEEHRGSPQALQTHVEDLTKRDVKVAYLKNLQGYLWQSGYENKAYATSLYEDVEPQLQQWHDSKVLLAIFSSGSVFAQKLLFKHIKRSEDDSNESKDLTGLISDWFDTVNAGPKTEAASYTKIAEAIGQETQSVLFLSDNVNEVRAAKDAGMHALIVDRPGNAPLTDADKEQFTVITSLSQINLAGADHGSSGVSAEEHEATNGDAAPEKKHEEEVTESTKKRVAEDEPEDSSDKITKAAKFDEKS